MGMLETKTEPMVLNMGPHHPSMHGCFRLIVTLDGEDVVDCEPVIGYLHRGMEKIAENRTNIMYVPYVLGFRLTRSNSASLSGAQTKQ